MDAPVGGIAKLKGDKAGIKAAIIKQRKTIEEYDKGRVAFSRCTLLFPFIAMNYFVNNFLRAFLLRLTFNLIYRTPSVLEEQETFWYLELTKQLDQASLHFHAAPCIQVVTLFSAEETTRGSPSAGRRISGSERSAGTYPSNNTSGTVLLLILLFFFLPAGTPC